MLRRARSQKDASQAEPKDATKAKPKDAQKPKEIEPKARIPLDEVKRPFASEPHSRTCQPASSGEERTSISPVPRPTPRRMTVRRMT